MVPTSIGDGVHRGFGNGSRRGKRRQLPDAIHAQGIVERGNRLDLLIRLCFRASHSIKNHHHRQSVFQVSFHSPSTAATVKFLQA